VRPLDLVWDLAPARVEFVRGRPLDAMSVAGDVAGQATATMDQLVLALAAVGRDLADVATCTVYVVSTDHTDLLAASAVVQARFGERDVPTTFVGVAVLRQPGQLVEVEAVAVAP